MIIGLLMLPMISLAGDISLELKSTVTIEPNLLNVKIEFHNRGNETASEFQPIVWINQRPHIIAGTQALLPGQSLHTKFELSQHPFQAPGLYYLPVQVQYRDQNGSRFKLPYLIRMERGTIKKSGLRMQANHVVLPEDDSVTLTLTNRDSWNKTVQLSNHMAMNIGLEFPKEPIELKPKESRTWTIPIKYGTLWPNTYDNYLIATFSYQGQHYTQFVKLRTKVIPDALVASKWFESQVMVGVLIVLCMIAFAGGYGPSMYNMVRNRNKI